MIVLNIICFSLTGTPRTAITDRSNELNTKMSSLFSGTQDKCIACDKKVYPLEKVLLSFINGLHPTNVDGFMCNVV